MPLQNRVDPFGQLITTSARGLVMGNRGGRIHRDDRTLGNRRWASRQWICCALHFKGRHRAVWSRGYTEMFFLDEVTALAAGHRPCIECRRADAKRFATAFAKGRALLNAPRADAMDRVLHAERLDMRAKRTFTAPIDGLPNGVMIAIENSPFALRDDSLLPWTPSGYARPLERSNRSVTILTPPSIVAALACGYEPAWHPSAQEAERCRSGAR